MDQDIFSQENLIKRYNQLPEKLKQAMSSMETISAIDRTVALNQLDEEKIKPLAYAVGLVLMGIYHRDNFKKYLAEDLGIDLLLGQKIAQEVDTAVFLPLREEIKSAYEMVLTPTIVVENPVISPENVSMINESSTPINNKKNAIEKSSLIIGDDVKIKKEEKTINPSKNEEVRIFPKALRQGGVSPISTPIKKFAPNLIVGKEDEVRPTLESSPILSSIFDQVASKKEKVVSSLEMESKIEPKKDIVFPIKRVNFPPETPKPFLDDKKEEDVVPVSNLENNKSASSSNDILLMSASKPMVNSLSNNSIPNPIISEIKPLSIPKPISVAPSKTEFPEKINNDIRKEIKPTPSTMTPPSLINKPMADLLSNNNLASNPVPPVIPNKLESSEEVKKEVNYFSPKPEVVSKSISNNAVSKSIAPEIKPLPISNLIPVALNKTEFPAKINNDIRKEIKSTQPTDSIQAGSAKASNIIDLKKLKF